MLSFAVVCEAPADREIATALADRVLMTEIPWLLKEVLEYMRQWRGYLVTHQQLLWQEVPDLARARNIRIHGKFQGEPGAPDAAAARRALRLLELSPERPDAVLLIRDMDKEDQRRAGLMQARDAHSWPFTVVIGTAHTKRECWVLAGFRPVDTQERQRLAELRQELGFDPTQHAQELTASEPGALRNAKRVLAHLTGGERQREARCWDEAELEHLRTHGKKTGLADFLDELSERLVPLLQQAPRAR